MSSLPLRHPARRYAYRGLKIFTSLALRFQDFQRLNIAIIGSSELACSVAAEVCQMMRAMEHNYPVLRDVGWQVHLYEESNFPFSAFERQHMALRNASLEKAGVTLHAQQTLKAIVQEGKVLKAQQDQSVGLIINACFSLPALIFQGQCGSTWPLQTLENLALVGHQHIWVAGPCATLAMDSYLTASDWEQIGVLAGYNAWAVTQGFATRHYVPKFKLVIPFAIGFQSFCDAKFFIFSGRIAWFMSRLSQLLAMPGLEKNLRIMIDWALVIPFRSDIAVLAPAPQVRLQKVRFNPGDEIYRQGDEAEMAYVVESGRLEIIKDAHKVGELGVGDYFGAMVQSYMNRRNETVRCIAVTELTVLSQNDFKVLTKGSGLINKALQHLAPDRYNHPVDNTGIKRVMYVSTMHVPFTDEEINELGRLSSANNTRLGLTGVLISVHEYFFQILEGPETVLDQLLDKIRQDSRHRDLTILSVEYGLPERLFTDWGMRTVRLNEDSGVLLQSIRMMLRTIAQSHHIIGRYTQPLVLKLLTEGINPLTIPIRHNQLIVLYGSFAGCSLSEGQMIAELIQEFFEISSSCIIEHGGQVADYIGDAMVAYFKPEHADAALAAVLDALHGFRELRTNLQAEYAEPIGYFGLSAGSVIEGNFGSSIKMNYSLLGPAVEEARRLSVLGQQYSRALVFDASIIQNAKPSWAFVALAAEAQAEHAIFTLDDKRVELVDKTGAIQTKQTAVAVNSSQLPSGGDHETQQKHFYPDAKSRSRSKIGSSRRSPRQK